MLVKIILRQMLSTPLFRSYICRLRYFYFTKIQKRLRTVDSPDAFPGTLEYSAKSIHFYPYQPRMDLLIRPTSAMELLNNHSKILIIGPRTESDVFYMMGLGFSKDSVRGLDLVSYSPLIDRGDMHAMPYADNAWDATLSAYCISYSKNPKKAADEMVRVTKNGGLIAVGAEYFAPTTEERFGFAFHSTKELLTLFEGRVGTIFFNHDAPLKQNGSPLVVLFSLKK